MRLVGWLGVSAVLAVLLLPRAEGADDKRALALEGELRTLREKVVAFEARLKVLEGAVQVSGGGLKLVSAGTVTIQGSGTVDLRGATLLLNGGGRPVARVGDPVVVQGVQGQIVGGSSTVLAQ
jgi:hypothetical protein